MLMLQTLYNGPKTNNITNNTSYNFVHVMLDTEAVRSNVCKFESWLYMSLAGQSWLEHAHITADGLKKNENDL